MNNVVLVGALKEEPRITKTKAGEEFALVTVGVAAGFDAIDWIECAAFGNAGAEAAEQCLTGDKVVIQGFIRSLVLEDREEQMVIISELERARDVKPLDISISEKPPQEKENLDLEMFLEPTVLGR